MVDAIGWLATAIFALSYLTKSSAALRRVQACAALLWISYGVLVKAPPVIVANVVVAGVAILSMRRSSGDERSPARRLRDGDRYEVPGPAAPTSGG